jgi:hypothetical protein
MSLKITIAKASSKQPTQCDGIAKPAAWRPSTCAARALAERFPAPAVDRERDRHPSDKQPPLPRWFEPDNEATASYRQEHIKRLAAHITDRLLSSDRCPRILDFRAPKFNPVGATVRHFGGYPSTAHELLASDEAKMLKNFAACGFVLKGNLQGLCEVKTLKPRPKPRQCTYIDTSRLTARAHEEALERWATTETDRLERLFSAAFMEETKLRYSIQGGPELEYVIDKLTVRFRDVAFERQGIACVIRFDLLMTMASMAGIDTTAYFINASVCEEQTTIPLSY